MTKQIPTQLFGNTNQSQDVYPYILKNKNSLEAEEILFGANLLKLLIPDKNDKFEDVILWYHTLQPYYHNPCFFGYTVLNTTQELLNKQVKVESKLRDLREDEMNAYEIYFAAKKGVIIANKVF